MYRVSIELLRNTSGSLGEREMLWEHEPQASVSTAFSSSPKLSQCFYNLTETRSTCFLFLLQNTVTRKKKTTCQLFFYHNVNSLCLRHHCVNSSC